MGAQTHAAPLDMARAAVVHPVTTPSMMYWVHASFRHLQYNVGVALTKEAGGAMADIMPLLPPEYQFSIPQVPDTTSATSAFQLTSTSSCVVVPRASYIPKNRHDIVLWEYFNQTRLMGVWRESPSVGIMGDVREEARTALSRALGHLQRGGGGERLELEVLENGYRRVDATRGSEYIFDLLLRVGGASSPQRPPIRKRVSLLRPYHEDLVPMPSPPSPEAPVTVNLIMALYGLSDRLERFLLGYEEEILGAGSVDVTLTVVVYESPDSHSATNALRRFADRHPASRVSVVGGVGNFSRGAGLHLASEGFSGDRLLFFVDVDLSVSAQAVRRCGHNVVRGRRVYFPVFFKLYNASFVGRHFRGETRRLAARHNGHWAHYSYGAVCLYADDYRKAGGFQLSAKGWGNEDVDFLERTLKAGLEPFRSPDPGLVHRWHPKVCERGALADEGTYQDCLRSRGENLADRIELASYVLASEEGGGA